MLGLVKSLRCVLLVATAAAYNLRTTAHVERSTNPSSTAPASIQLRVPLVPLSAATDARSKQSKQTTLLQLTPLETKALKEHVDSVKLDAVSANSTTSTTPPPSSPRNSRADLNEQAVVEELNAHLSNPATKYPGVTTPKPRVIRMCSRGELSNVKVHIDTEGIATEGFQVQAVMTDTTTGQIAPLAAMTIIPSVPFWLGTSEEMKNAAAKGGAAAASRDEKATQDLVLKASPGSTLLGPAEYELHLQIVSPDPAAIASDFTGQMVGNSKYNYGRMQQLLDEVSFLPIQIQDCGDDGKMEQEEPETVETATTTPTEKKNKKKKEKVLKDKKSSVFRPAAVSMVAELQHTEADTYFKLTDVDDAAKTAFARLAGDHIERDQIADFRLENGDRPGRTKVSLRIIFSNRELAHLAAIEMMKEKSKWENILFETMKTTLTSIGVKNTLSETPIRHFIVAEQPYENDDKAKTVCCQARTATCMACARGIAVEAYCAVEPATPGCSAAAPAKGDDVPTNTVEQYLVDVILKVHPPSHSLGIFEGATDVPKELQTSMQASMSVLNYADPDMAVRSVQVESATDGQKKIPLVHVTLSTSSHSNAVKLSDILSKSSTVQKDFMGKSLTDAFHATKQLGEDDVLRVDNIEAKPVVQPVPDAVNSMWDRISQKAKFNKLGDITWAQIMEATGSQPPLSRAKFEDYCAGETSLSATGLRLLREKQAVSVL